MSGSGVVGGGAGTGPGGGFLPGASGPRGIVVAIDGPAASGKSTTASAVARRLDYTHLNSGLLYRAITWAALRGSWADDPDRFLPELERLRIEVEREDGVRVRVEGKDPGADLVSPAVTERVSGIAARPPVRARVLVLLRQAAAEGGVVCDGRDIGTVVFPGAALKVYLTADAEERARRRLRERAREPDAEALAAETTRLRERDRADSTRAHAPLRRAEDAVLVDTTRLAPEAVVERIVTLAQARETGSR